MAIPDAVPGGLGPFFEIHEWVLVSFVPMLEYPSVIAKGMRYIKQICVG